MKSVKKETISEIIKRVKEVNYSRLNTRLNEGNKKDVNWGTRFELVLKRIQPRT